LPSVVPEAFKQPPKPKPVSAEDALISKLEHDNKFSPNIIRGIMSFETTNYDPNAVSSAGARGVMQLMPPTAVKYHVKDPRDRIQSINGGAEYLNYLYGVYRNDFDPPLSKEDVDKFVLAEYNGGDKKMLKAGLIPIKGKPGMFKGMKYNEIEPYLESETRYYVRNVTNAMKQMKVKKEREEIYRQFPK
jgi:soluble lytic murein transglycosylase-like protein